MLRLTKKSSEIGETSYSPRAELPLSMSRKKSCYCAPEFENLNDENVSTENFNFNFKEVMFRVENDSSRRKIMAKYNKVIIHMT